MLRAVSPRLALLTLAHFSVDAYSSFLTPLLPVLVTRLGLSLTQVGVLVACMSVASSLSQPLFGLLADRVRRPWFIALGPVLAAAFLSSVGLATGFLSLIAIVVIGGLGTAAFHPQAAVLASSLGRRRAVSMSVFVTGGTIGFSLGPLFAVAVLGRLGLERTFWAAIPGLVVALLVVAWFARVAPHTGGRVHAPIRELKPFLRPIALLYFAVVVRSAVGYGFMTFLPIHLHRLGWSVAAGGTLLTTYLVCGAVGGLAGGWLNDRVGGRRVILWSFVGSAPLYLAFPFLPLAAGLAGLALGNVMLQASLPVNVVMGQELSPRHASTLSSLLMGAAWGFGVLLVGLVGALADRAGLTVALASLASLLVIGIALALALPDVRRHAGVVESALAPTSS